MRNTRIMNVLITAGVSAALHGAMAVLFVPTMAALFLAHRSVGVYAPDAATTDTVMLLAVAAPICWTVLGFIFGAAMAFIYSLYTAEAAVKVKATEDQTLEAYAASSQAA
jgi:hypothetical protein